MDEDMFDDIYGLHCHVCTELFSTDPKSILAPAETACGHYVCLGCIDKLKTSIVEKKYFSYMCGLCKRSFSFYPPPGPAKGFIAFIAEIQKKYIKKQAKNKCEIVCESCNTWVHIDKARVCKVCCVDVDKSFSPDVLSRRVVVFTAIECRRDMICCECALENHIGMGHELVKYYKIKNRRDAADSQEKSEHIMSTYRLIIKELSSIHRTGINNMSKASRRVHNLAKIASSSGDCDSALVKLHNDIDTFEKESEVLLPVLRKYSDIVKDIGSIFPKQTKENGNAGSEK